MIETFTNKKPDGGPAFPGERYLCRFEGMSLRDYFAAAALTGIQQWDALVNEGMRSHFIGDDGMKNMAKIAYMVADAMLAKRDK